MHLITGIKKNAFKKHQYMNPFKNSRNVGGSFYQISFNAFKV